MQVALTALWRSVGVDANCIVGQSVGEVAAAHAAGCLDLQQAVRVVYHRTRLLAQATGGAMIVVRNLDVQKVKQVKTTSCRQWPLYIELSLVQSLETNCRLL